LDWGPGGKAIAHPELLAFLEQHLDNGLPTVVLTHHHLVPVGSKWIDNFLPEKAHAEAFWKLLTDHRQQVLGVLSGHCHVTYERIVQGIPVLGLRSTAMQFVLQDEPLYCVQPLHYRFVTIQNNILTSRIFEVSLY
jgi:Icc protein